MILVRIAALLAATATPGAAAPIACEVPARSIPAVIELLASSIATPEATTGGQTLPEGSPVDAQTQAEMERVVRTWLACQNAGEPLRAWSLFSDGYLYRLLSRQGTTSEEDLAELATPWPESEGGAALLHVEGHRALPDGRWGATVTIAYPSVPMPKNFFFYFTRIDGRLRIDGILGEISFSVP
jgi:hypothetical protein